MSTPRGVRNNNPGNIDRTAVAWKGEDRSDAARARESRFAVFEKPEDGFRALSKALQTYQSKYGLRTVRGIINRWAPPVENNTSAYVTEIAKALGVSPDRQIDVLVPQTAFQLLKSIAHHENGAHYWTDAVIWRGLELAGVTR